MNMAAHINFQPDKAEQATSLLGYIAFAGVSLLAALAAWSSWTSYSDQRTAEQASELANPLDPPTAATLSMQDRESRISSLKAEIRQNPLDADALTDLAILLNANGQQAEADRLTLLAADRSLRNVPARLLALDLKLKQGKLGEALANVDGLIRSSPALAPQLFDQLMVLAGSKEGSPDLIKLLASNPPWREAFFARAAAGNTETFAIYNLLSGLRDSDAPPSDAELRGLLTRMVKAKDYAGAFYIWLDTLSERDIKLSGNVFDSGFELQPRNLYFDWMLTRSRSVEVKLVARATGSADHMLRVDYINNRDAVAPAQQMLRLSPGDYVLSGEQRSDNLKTESGILWQLRCSEGGDGVLAQSPKLAGSTQWARFDVPFSVPADCTTQHLLLRSASYATLDQQVSGTAAFDNIAISGVSGNE